MTKTPEKEEDQIRDEKLWDRIISSVLVQVRKVRGSPCWIWKGAKAGPYGIIKVGGKLKSVRRLTYELANPHDPPGENRIESICKDSNCVNPKHLRKSNRTLPSPPDPKLRKPSKPQQAPASNIIIGRYPYDAWFAASEVVLRKGLDYKCQSHGLAQQIRSASAARGVQVSLSVQPDKVTIMTIRRRGK